MIVNTLAKTLSTPKEQDIEMPPVHEICRKRGWEDATRPPVHEKARNHGWQARNEVIIHENSQKRGWQAVPRAPCCTLAPPPLSNPRGSCRLSTLVNYVRARSAGFVQSLIRDDEFPDWASVEEHPACFANVCKSIT